MGPVRIRIAVLLLYACIFLPGCGSRYKPEDAFATEERHSSEVSVRLTAYKERRAFGQALGGAYYVFEAKNKDDQNWNKFLIVANDDLEPINKDNLALVNEKTAYGFMLKQFAVTTDAGKTWSISDLSKLDSTKADPGCRIEKVSVTETGTGTMNVKCGNSERVLATRDFGVTWPGPNSLN